jgi:hypothetical protein
MCVEGGAEMQAFPDIPWFPPGEQVLPIHVAFPGGNRPVKFEISHAGGQFAIVLQPPAGGST